MIASTLYYVTHVSIFTPDFFTNFIYTGYFATTYILITYIYSFGK